MGGGRCCAYYKHTGNGTRCVFLSPEEWRMRAHSLKEYCLRGGNGCPILGRVLAKTAGNRFLFEVNGKKEGSILGNKR